MINLSAKYDHLCTLKMILAEEGGEVTLARKLERVFFENNNNIIFEDEKEMTGFINGTKKVFLAIRYNGVIVPSVYLTLSYLFLFPFLSLSFSFSLYIYINIYLPLLLFPTSVPLFPFSLFILLSSLFVLLLFTSRYLSTLNLFLNPLDYLSNSLALI